LRSLADLIDTEFGTANMNPPYKQLIQYFSTISTTINH
jgi:hypothetical protein